MNDIFDELVSSNYWNGKLPKVEFARKSYTNRIFGYVGNRLVKVLTGQRGVGKGCLLRRHLPVDCRWCFSRTSIYK